MLIVKIYSLLFKMKKFVVVIVVSFCLLPLWWVYAEEISTENKAMIDEVWRMIESQQSTKSLANQVQWYEKFVNSFSVENISWWVEEEMIEYLLERVQTKIWYLKPKLVSQKDSISNVDRDKVDEAWLSWHNAERSKKGLTPYTYNDLLDYTALSWAKQISAELRKTWSTHARKAGDWYWNTSSIKSRFTDMWVSVSSFSESNAYGYYNCNKSDCTQEMINALKTCFNRTYLNSAHYGAVVSKVYDQIGYWVWKNWKYIWVTTHYWADVK